MQNRILFFLHASRSRFAAERSATMIKRWTIQRKGVVASCRSRRAGVLSIASLFVNSDKSED